MSETTTSASAGPTGRSEEARAAYSAYIQTRDAILAGDEPWSALARHFTDDAVFIDPAWGRIEGLANITEFFVESMRGLEGWEFPEEWTIVDGDQVVSAWWNRLPGSRADGSPFQALGISTLWYAGDGKFSYEHDLLNMLEVIEIVTESGWVPPDHNMPAHPNRDISR